MVLVEELVASLVLVARLEEKREENADDDEQKTDWREVASWDMNDSNGEPLYEDPRQHAWLDLPQETWGKCPSRW
jgi:hypothetical protein